MWLPLLFSLKAPPRAVTEEKHTIMKHLNLLLMCIFVCWSCSSGGDDEPVPPKPDDKPVIEIPSSQSSPVLEQTGGTASVTFSTDAAWTATVNEAATRAATWISVSPTSGNAGSHTLTVTTTENDTYDERNATVILKAGTTSKTFTVKQKQKDALTVTSSKIELTAIGGQATIEVKANVQYQYEVEQTAQSWITPAAATRGLTSSSLVFDVAENENTEKRECLNEEDGWFQRDRRLVSTRRTVGFNKRNHRFQRGKLLVSTREPSVSP